MESNALFPRGFGLLIPALVRLDVLADHFLERLSLAFDRFGHAVRHCTASSADACHYSFLLFHPFYFLADNLIFVFYADFALVFVARPEQVYGNAGYQKQKYDCYNCTFIHI